MKLTSFRLIDQGHLLDLLSVGLIDETWRDRLPAELVPRLQKLIAPRRDEAWAQAPLDRRSPSP
jgi:hypothetical protein